LLPALGTAQETARRSQCASNLRQLVQAHHLYNSDNDEWIPGRSSYYHQRGRDAEWSYGRGCFRSIFRWGYLGPALEDQTDTVTLVSQLAIDLTVCPSNWPEPRKNSTGWLEPLHPCRRTLRAANTHMGVHHGETSSVGTLFYAGGGIYKEQAHWTGGLLRDLRAADVLQSESWVFLGDFVSSDPTGWPDGWDSGWTYLNANWTNHMPGQWDPRGGNFAFHDGHVVWYPNHSLYNAGECKWPVDHWSFWYNGGRLASSPRSVQWYWSDNLRAAQSVISNGAIR